jgi:Acetyl-CoA carboxylase, carboxyltransferase component (subunits alpha and beta)
MERIEQEARLGGGPAAIEKQHKRGKLTARERIALLFDKGTFVELNMFARHQCHDFGMEERRPWGDAVITGYGNVNGRKVFAYAQDFTTLGGTVGFTSASKVVEAMRMAVKAKAPVVGFIDTGGARIQEGSGTYSLLFYDHVRSSGVVPQISCILGSCAGGGCYSPALTDFIFMVEGISQMFISGPRVIKAATGEEITNEELGGPKPHSQISGVCDVVNKNEEECIEQVKKLLGFLPSSCYDKPPIVDTGDGPYRCDQELLGIVPPEPKRPYDMKRVIRHIVDNGDFFEVKANFALNMITGFARIGGYPAGIVANQPLVMAGSIDCDASDKAARFYRFCDCFNIPIITLTDVPGYLPGVKEEYKGIIRHGAKMLYGYIEADVPKILCVVRKAYGGSWAAMGSKTMGADITFAWPTAEMAIMGAEGAVEVLYRKEIEAAEDKQVVRQEKMKEYREKFSSPYHYAGKMVVDLLIKPQETRPHLFSALQLLWNKPEERIPRKHGNIPL